MRLWGRKEESLDLEAVKARSMAEIQRLGGRTIDHLPTIEETAARSGEAGAARALVLNALVGLAYDAPAALLREWIVANGLTSSLSAEEAAMLEKGPEGLTEQERIDLSWRAEAILALLWAGGLAPSLPPAGEFPEDALAALPRVGQGESGAPFVRRFRLRPYAELYAMRDLYYRAHWHARDQGLKGADPAPFLPGAVVERRRALEWLMDEAADWDDVEMGT